MLSDAPSWMDMGGSEPRRQKARTGEGPASGSAGEGGAAEQRVRATIKAGGGNKEMVAQLVEILAKLVLQNSRDLQGLIGATYRTYMQAGAENLIQTSMLEGGRLYNEMTTKLKGQKEQAEKEKAEPVDLEAVGAPFLHIMMHTTKELAQVGAQESQKLLSAELATRWVQLWNQMTALKSIAEVGRMVRYLRGQRLRTGKKKGWMKVQVCFVSPEVGELWHETMMHFTFQEKVGPAPRSALERDAQKLLDKFKQH